jgi:hypothetical protein
MLRFFEFAHLREDLRQTSAHFRSLAVTLVDELPPGPEKTMAMRKLLEAKDCAVRALIS